MYKIEITFCTLLGPDKIVCYKFLKYFPGFIKCNISISPEIYILYYFSICNKQSSILEVISDKPLACILMQFGPILISHCQIVHFSDSLVNQNALEPQPSL